MMKNLIYKIACCLLLTLTACNKEEAIPAYIHIEEATLQTTLTQGTADSDLRYVEVFAGIDQIGLFHLPATIPIIREGTTELDIFMGINDNGISATPIRYGLLNGNRVSVDLVPGEVLELDLEASYKDNLEFVFVEGFESANQIFREDYDDDLMTEVSLTSTDVFEGSRSGSLVVTDEHPLLVVGSAYDEDFPPGGAPVYLEINHKAEIPFEIGLRWFSTSIGWETDWRNVINARDAWGKIYINYTEPLRILNTISGIDGWQIVIRARMPQVNGTVVTGSREVLLDNFKVIHIK